MRTHSKIIIAHHLIHTGYAHWLSNDPRGSGSEEIRKEELSQLGKIHHGRKRIQPSRQELREFYRDAELLLAHPTIWFDAAKRQALADAFAQVAREFRYTLYAFAVMRNHVHSLVRRHRDDAEVMWHRFAAESQKVLRGLADVPNDHPIWSERPYKVFCYTPDEISTRIDYIEDNPEKEGLPRQSWSFVTKYNGWPNPKDWTRKHKSF